MEETKEESKVTKIRDMKIRICSHAWEKIHGWCMAANSEVSGFGLVKKKDGVFTIYDSFLPEQECSSGGTTMTREGQSKMKHRIFKMGKPLSEIRLWWHTHYNFNCFWSGIDDGTAEGYAGSCGNWLISIVTNQKNEYKCRLDIVSPIKMTIDDLDLEFIGGHKIRNNNWDYQVGRKVKERHWQNVLPTGWSFDSNDNLVGPSSNIDTIRDQFRGLGPRWWEKKEERKDSEDDIGTKDLHGNEWINHGGIIMPKWEYDELIGRENGRVNGSGENNGEVSQPLWID